MWLVENEILFVILKNIFYKNAKEIFNISGE